MGFAILEAKSARFRVGSHLQRKGVREREREGGKEVRRERGRERGRETGSLLIASQFSKARHTVLA